MVAEVNSELAELCRRFVAHAQDAVAILGTDGRIHYANGAALALFNYPSDAIVGRPGAVLYDAQDIAQDKPGSDLAATAAEGHLRYEGWRVRADGSRFWAEIAFTALYDAAARPRGYGLLVRDVTDRRRFHTELMRRALHDTLTDLPNRALLLDRLGKAIRRLERHPAHLAVFFLDLDRFKAINDTFGHRAGDRVLVTVAQRLRTALRAQDTVARLSGDEFAAVCEGLDGRAAAAEIGRRLAQALSPPVDLSGQLIPLHASIGGVVIECASADPQAVLDDADRAMYRAKRRTEAQSVRFEF